MKKIFTLVAVTFLTAAVFAQRSRVNVTTTNPTVTLTTTSFVLVVIDGQSYSENSSVYISNNRSGQHSIQVYAKRNSHSSFRNRGEQMLSSTSFRTGRESLHISVGNNGEVLIETDREYAIRTSGGYSDRNSDYNRGRDDNSRNDGQDSRRRGRDRRF